MLEESLAGHLFAQMGESVRPLVQIRLVNLENVSREHHFRAFSGPRDDGLYLVRSQVLGFVNDEICIAETPSADICERGYEQFLVVHETFEFLVFLAARPVKGLDDIQIVRSEEHTSELQSRI